MFNSFTARACQARAHCRCVGRLARFPQAHKDKRDKTLRLTKAAAAAAAAWAIRKFFRREGRAPRAARRATTARPTALRAAHCCPPARAARIGAASALHRRYIDSHSLKTSSGMPAVMRCTLCMSLPGLGSGLGLGLGLGLALGLGLGLGYS